jgi:hypothetical protein
MAGGNLNVIFHGLFAFVVHEDCLEVLMPAMTKERAAGQEVPDEWHQYHAGAEPPGAPLTLAAGMSYQLQGVSGSDTITRFPPDVFPVVQRYGTIDRTSEHLRGSIYMPFPNNITGLRRIPLGANRYFEGRAASRITTTCLPLVYVLRYAFANPADIFLDKWKVPAASGNRNLHIFAEPADQTGLPQNHVPEAFRHLVRMFPGLDLGLIMHGWAPPDNPSGVCGINGDGHQRSLIELGPNGLGAMAAPPDLTRDTRICISLVVDNA